LWFLFFLGHGNLRRVWVIWGYPEAECASDRLKNFRPTKSFRTRSTIKLNPLPSLILSNKQAGNWPDTGRSEKRPKTTHHNDELELQ
jgi:hypothetical protein